MSRPFNSYFETEAEARLAWQLYELCRAGNAKKAGGSYTVRPFPGDTPAKPAVALSRASRTLFERLRQVALPEYAGRYTELRPAGPGKWKGRCPLHEERTPSFYIRQAERGWSWRCFGACAMGGDIVDLARELKQRRS